MAEKPPERLFRDDGGAAIERAARLEDENRQLKAEIERLRRPGRDAPTVRTRLRSGEKVFILGLLGGSAVAGLWAMFLTARAPAEPRLPPPPRMPATWVAPADPPPPAPPVHDVTSSPPSTGTVIGASPLRSNDCTRPFWYDERGVKHYKAHCLAR